MNLKIPGRVFFCLSLFQIFKKAYLRIRKYLGQFFAHTLFKYLKKHSYESEDTSFHTNNFKGNNLYKNHYTNNSHKNYYTNR